MVAAPNPRGTPKPEKNISEPYLSKNLTPAGAFLVSITLVPFLITYLSPKI